MDTLLQELLAFKQEMLSMDDYTGKFNDLTIHYNLGEADHMDANRHRARSHHEIQREMVMYDFEFVDDIHRKAHQVEQQLRQQNLKCFSSSVGVFCEERFRFIA